MRTKNERINGSYRDPSGYVFINNGRIFRAVHESFSSNLSQARKADIYKRAAKYGFLIDTCEVEDISVFGLEKGVSHVLEHERVPYVSYPYEWTFDKLKRAALHHLEFHMYLLENGFNLSDGSAYNIQFIGEKPIFIDALSIIPYKNDSHWNGYKQYCSEFLNPLLFTSIKKLPFNSWYRGTASGISNQELFQLLSAKDKLDWRIITFIGLEVWMERRLLKKNSTNQTINHVTNAKPVPLTRLTAMLEQLHRWITTLTPPQTQTIWKNYDSDNIYDNSERKLKREIVQSFTARHNLKTIFDIGCNSGDYSIASLEAGAEYAVGFDFDHQALSKAEKRAKERELNFLSLWLDAANPSPSQGWLHTERDSFQDRRCADGVIALAIAHHLAIAKNIPLQQVIVWLVGLAPRGLIEFIPKSDHTVSAMLSARDDIFTGYSEEEFYKHLSSVATIINKTTTSESGRVIYEYENHN